MYVCVCVRPCVCVHAVQAGLAGPSNGVLRVRMWAGVCG